MYYDNIMFIQKLILPKIDLLKETIMQLNYLIIKVSGESMLPRLVDGQKVIIVPVLMNVIYRWVI